MGRPEKTHVHHKNWIKGDNSPENLEPMSPTDHALLHRPPKVDRALMVELYKDGASTLEIGRQLGIDHSNVYRGLVKMGVKPRSISESQTVRLDQETILRMFEQGYSPDKIGKALGVSRGPIIRILRECGIPPRSNGRPRT